jgi:uncharacterized protein YhaN
MEDARALADAARREAQALSDQQAQTRLQHRQLAAGGGAITLEAVHEARAHRDAGWRRLRAHLLGDTILDDPSREAGAFERAIADADALADRRYVSAADSGRLSALEDTIALLALQAEQARSRGAAAEAAEAGAVASWSARLAGAGLPDHSPAELRAWRERRVQALSLAAAADEAAASARAEAERLTAARAMLRAASGDDRTGADALAPALAYAERRLALGQAQAQAQSDARKALAATEAQLAALAGRISAAERARDERRAAWAAAIAEAGVQLAPEGAEPRLDLYERLRGLGSTIDDLEHRVDAMASDKARFDARVLALAAELGEDADERAPEAWVDALLARLERAKRSAQARDALTADAKRHADEVRAAEAALAAAEASLAPAMTAAGVVDRAALAAAVEASRHRRGLAADLAAVEREIGTHGELDELIAACAAQDPEALARACDQWDGELHGCSPRSRLKPTGSAPHARRSRR